MSLRKTQMEIPPRLQGGSLQHLTIHPHRHAKATFPLQQLRLQEPQRVLIQSPFELGRSFHSRLPGRSNPQASQQLIEGLSGLPMFPQQQPAPQEEQCRTEVGRPFVP